MNKYILNFLLGAVLIGLTAQLGRASEFDKKTVLTISGPMRIPGTVLPAGTYVMKRADPNLPNVIRFFDKDGRHLYATVLTLPVERKTATGDVELTMAETRSSSPAALRTWFYPGELTGQEFIYPRGGEVLMAQSDMEVQGLAPAAVKETEPAKVAIMEPEREPVLEQIESSSARTEENVELAQSTAPQSTPVTATPTRQDTNPPMPTSQDDMNNLPQTAGLLPLLALLGTGALLGGTGLKAAARKHQS